MNGNQLDREIEESQDARVCWCVCLCVMWMRSLVHFERCWHGIHPFRLCSAKSIQDKTTLDLTNE